MNCHCTAYRFPHRAGSGQCIGPAPACRDCEHARIERDPHATGDRQHVEIECMASSCPYGKQ